MKYSDRRPGKGFLKDYNGWLNDHLYDYKQSNSEDPLEKMNVKLLENFSKLLIVNGDRRRIYHKPKVEKVKRVHSNSSFDGLLFFRTIFDKGTMSSWLIYLTAKDVFALLGTSKSLNLMLDCKEVWMSLINRDFDHSCNRLLEQKQISLKYLYKYNLITNKIGILYNTGSFLDKGLASEANLARTIIDFTTVTTFQIKELLSCMKVENGMINHLKLSWQKEKNEIILWFSGYSVIGGSIIKPTAHTIQTYKFPQSSSIKNAWFSEDKYLVIEVDLLITLDAIADQEEQRIKTLGNSENIPNQKVKKTVFYLYSLNQEIEYALTGMGTAIPMTFSFSEKLESVGEGGCASNFGCSSMRDVTIWLDKKLGDDKGNEEELEIHAKFLHNDQLLFFSKQRQNLTLAAFHLKNGNRVFQTVLSLEAPLVDIIEAESTKYTDSNYLFLVDEDSNLYKISYAVNTLLEFVHINSRNDETQMKDQQSNSLKPGPIFQRFPASSRKTHKGKYYCVEEQQREIEFLVLLKNGGHFEFIDLESVEVHKFYLPDTIEADYISDWKVLEDKLFVVTNQEMGIWKFSFPNFKIQQTIDNIQTQWRNISYYKQWIQADPCFTVLVSSYGDNFYELENMEILVNSTQVILGEGSDKLTQGFHTSVKEILLRPSTIERPFKLTPQNVKVKYQNGKLLIATSNYSFFFDLDITVGGWSSHAQNRWVPSQAIDLRKIIRPSDTDAIKSIPKISHQSQKKVKCKLIHINKNEKKEKIHWTHCPKKDYDKFYRQENLLVRRKGYKYVKNLRADERSRKFKDCFNESNHNSYMSESLSDTLQEDLLEQYE